MTDPRRRIATLAVIGAMLVLLVAAGLGVLTRYPLSLNDDTRNFAFIVSICLAGLLWLLAVAVVRRGRLPRRTVWMVLVVAVAMRAMTLAGPPLLSTDLYRYVWDGRVQLSGISPYSYLPIAPELEFMRDSDVYPHIGRMEYARTVYPPAAQALFAFAAVATPGVFGMKLLMAAFDALTIAVLALLLRVAERDPAELLVYAWLPLPVWEFVGNAHLDAVVAGLLTLALLAAVRGRGAFTGVILAAATLTKFLPAAVLPAFWRPPDWRLPAAFAVTLVVFYLPYVSVGWQVLGFLGGYVSEEGFENGHGIFLLDLLGSVASLPGWAPKTYIALAVMALGAVAARFALGGALPTAPGARVLLQARQAVIIGAAVLVAVSPHYPWYFGWLAPLACLAPLPSVLWMLAAAPLLAHGAFEYLAVPGAVYGPAAILAVLDLRRNRTQPSPMPPQAVRSI